MTVEGKPEITDVFTPISPADIDDINADTYMSQFGERLIEQWFGLTEEADQLQNHTAMMVNYDMISGFAREFAIAIRRRINGQPLPEIDDDAVQVPDIVNGSSVQTTVDALADEFWSGRELERAIHRSAISRLVTIDTDDYWMPGLAETGLEVEWHEARLDAAAEAEQFVLHGGDDVQPWKIAVKHTQKFDDRETVFMTDHRVNPSEIYIDLYAAAQNIMEPGE